jgi:hypothetical protein
MAKASTSKLVDEKNVLLESAYVKFRTPFYDGRTLLEVSRFGVFVAEGTMLPKTAEVLRSAEEAPAPTPAVKL